MNLKETKYGNLYQGQHEEALLVQDGFSGTNRMKMETLLGTKQDWLQKDTIKK